MFLVIPEAVCVCVCVWTFLGFFLLLQPSEVFDIRYLIIVVQMRVWSGILGISVLTGGIWSAEITRSRDSSEASSPNDREGKCMEPLENICGGGVRIF